MYCPRCGQQQVSDDMRFCSRCGLAMTGLARWVSGAGGSDKPSHTAGLSPSPRRKLMKRGAKLMFVSVVLFILCLFFSLAIDEGAPLIFPILLFFISLVVILYARLFRDPTPEPAPVPELASRMNKSALPPASSLPTYEGVAQKIKTRELAEPPSVTENTTKLLDTE